MEMARAHLFVVGRVQGVCYRAFTRDVANSLRLNGWVRNLADGRVEAVLEGEKKTIEQAIQQCYIGPPGARVLRIEVQWEHNTNGEEGFFIRY